MANYIISDINEMKQFLSEQLPEWGKTTAETLLTTLSHSDNQLVKETAEWIKVSSKSGEMVILLDFALSMMRNDPFPIRESIYDTATDGIRELNQHRIGKYSSNQGEKNYADANNWLWWLFCRIPEKSELKRIGLMY